MVGDDEIQPVFSGLREDVGEAFCGKVLELVDIKKEILSLLFGDIHPAHGSHLEFRDHETSKESCIIFADATL